MNVDFVEPRLKDWILPRDILQKVYLGRCAYDFDPICSAPAALMTDFNIWSRALDKEDMFKWSTCQ